MQFKMPRVVRNSELLQILWENQVQQQDFDYSQTVRTGLTAVPAENSSLISRIELSSIKDLYNVQIFVGGDTLQKAISGQSPVGCNLHA